jgi:hypothetical protein
MSGAPTGGTVEFIWATRGKAWGFSFLRRGGLVDPLRVYETAFSRIGDRPQAFRRVGDKVVLRFPDPAGRRDRAGRVIPHDFVLMGSLADEVNSLEDGRERMWNEVGDEFERIWDKPDPPAPAADEPAV